MASHSRTPSDSRRRVSPSPPPRRQRGWERVLVERQVVKEIGNAGWPMLTKTNYAEWSAMMKVMLRPRGLWEAVNHNDVSEHEDMMAMEAICKSVPADMVVMMANKESAKAAWDDIKTANLGVERVRRAKAQTLRREFNGLTFKDGESVDDFAMSINTLVQQLRTLGDVYTEPTVVRQFL